MNRWRAEYDDGIWRFYRDGMELGLYEKGDVVVGALNVAESRIAELEAEVTKCHELQDSYCDRIAELKAIIDRLIEVGEKMFTAVIAAADSYDEGMRVWDKIVNGWKEG